MNTMTLRRPLYISAEKFYQATGREPRDDDLERCNCTRVGRIGHECCGWNVEHDKPQFEIGPVVRKSK